ncbi:MAG: threonine synthase [Planctomycetes bacterium]|nr:threonine synthase [Planctomycetota bacterium]
MKTMTKNQQCFVTHLEAAIDGTHLESGIVQTMHNDRPLWVRYDLNAIAKQVSRDDLKDRPQSLWRYRELLPVNDDAHIVSLGETITPLIHCPRLGKELGAKKLFIKDESRLPTGSFKARGMAMAVSMAKQFGIKRVAVPTAGNAGGALAAYAAKAQIECYIFMPSDTPMVNRYEAGMFGAKVFLIDALINECGRIVREGKEQMDWFDISTLKEPYRIEGKKTMGLELAEQMNWKLPDVIMYPTGGGTGLIGMCKAFDELEEIGWLETDKRPRMFACQSSGCPPIVNAFDSGERFAEPIKDPQTIASGLRVPGAVGDFMILDAVRNSGGMALAADESQIKAWMTLASSLEGISLCPESAVCIGALKESLTKENIDPEETIVIFNTGAVQKYVEVMQTDIPTLDHTKPIDWSRFEIKAK